jgi:alanine racemase
MSYKARERSGLNETVDEIVRAGIVLYGISPLPEFQKLLKPAMTWKTRIGLIRDVPKGASISYGRTFITPKPMRVATMTAGYADGYPRHLSNVDAQMLVRGKTLSVAGPRDDGFNGNRRFAYSRCRSWR